ncbi:MAG: aspartate aminotransferase family protein [Methylobacterium sp.]|nr:aspartate aminotransferase family protein [Methylobacterium sp.]MCA3607873.1 aspartate aminotransferase family protein [Methylobacterium sp.]MCA3610305.1 aspartate aminotransferase family protein [Methylobacterium sp.]MCA3618469.1 aspartate aminotransferase family protein [Methylobacterium sp.]MCA3622336.1 aspartate aminotransferase family protein [Methylobacterium sp.]
MNTSLKSAPGGVPKVEPNTQSALLPTYARAELAFERGNGAWLTSTDGRRYLDFAAGIAVNVAGHAHPHLVNALTEQAGKLWHVSNVYRIPEGERLAKRLTELTFADVVFFTNSGAEALECAIKMARKYHAANGNPERYRLITFEGAFHGRTLATIAAGGQKKYLEGFGPPVEGFDQVAFGDHKAMEAAIGPETAGILIEPVQGEGGVRPVPPQCMRGLRELCDKHGILLVLDEVQSGVGRSGKLFAHEWSGITPDIMAVAKGIGGGFPMGACLATREAGKGMVAGTHGSTYGGNPLAMAVGNAVLDVVTAPGFLENVQQMSLRLSQRLAELKDRFPGVIAEVRGSGLLMGLKMQVPNTEFVAALRNEGLLTVGAGDNVVRLLPPLIIGEEEVRCATEAIERAASAFAQKSSNAA